MQAEGPSAVAEPCGRAQAGVCPAQGSPRPGTGRKQMTSLFSHTVLLSKLNSFCRKTTLTCSPSQCLPSSAACPCPSWPASAAAPCQPPRAGSKKWAHSPETETGLEPNTPCTPPLNTPSPGCHQWGEGDNTLERTWQKEPVPGVMENMREPRVCSLERQMVFQGETPLPGSHAGKQSLRLTLVCGSNIHKGSEARIRKCHVAELLALTHHRGERGETWCWFAKHRQAQGGWTRCWSAWFQAKCSLL